MSSARRGLAVAIVGSGPAGFYAASELLVHDAVDATVDMFDRLATPWGLVRFGVAPDHPKIKSVSAVFEKVATNDGFRFWGNVHIGRDITRDDLVARYDAVIYAVGAPADRKLGVAGEELPGCVGAADIVAWYNGHPDHADLKYDFNTERAVVVGNGNVALDVARILCSPPDRLAETDIADHALDALRDSKIKEVLVVGRRGAGQAAFTTAEIKELAVFTGSGVDVVPGEVAEVVGEAELPRLVQRNLAVLREYARGELTLRDRHVTLRFQRSPVEIRGELKVEEIVLGHNDLTVAEDGSTVASDTGRRETVATGLVVRAVGYKGSPITGVPVNDRSGTIANSDGRVQGSCCEYVVGWCKRGPQGVIGTNKQDSKDTVAHLLDDFAAGRLRRLDSRSAMATEDTIRWLGSRRLEVVSQEGWLRIDNAERAAGALQGRPRVKICKSDRLLDVAHGRMSDCD
jgi:ferredoxin--NADP+ reductase